MGKLTDRRKLTSEQYEARIAELQIAVAKARAELDQAYIDPTYGCLTKAGLLRILETLDTRGLYVVYFDMDRFKQHNSDWGKFVINARVRECIKPRASDPVAHVGRWFSGDELAGLFGDYDHAVAYANRLRRGFGQYGMTLTTVILPLDYKSAPVDTLNFAELAVAALKDHEIRDVIVQIGAR